MISLLASLFIKDRKNYADAAVRSAYGSLCSITGIVLNLVLFAIKYFAGMVSGSIAITADAFNNLSDASSSIITFVGFKAAASRPDSDHPFGHGRYEYLSGFIVSIIILIMGFELAKSSVEKIIHPVSAELSALSFIILGVSILVKLYMFIYNRRYARLTSSPALSATATDSLSDCVSTFVVMLCGLVSRYAGFNADAYGGILVSLFILWSGISAAKDTISPLIGSAPSAEFVSEVENIIRSHEEIIGIHDMMVHDYGPGRRIVSVHGEVSGAGDIFALHDVIDNIETELQQKLGCEAVIHMDPIDMEDSRVFELRDFVSSYVKGISPELSVHDLRIVPGTSHSNVIFDLVVPPRFPIAADAVSGQLSSAVSERFPGCNCVIKTENSYV